MADFPTTIYEERTTENLPGIVFDPLETKNLFSEDFQNHAAEIIAIETALGVGLENVQAPLGFTAENVANKKLNLSDNSDTYYPSQKAVKDAVDLKLNKSNVFSKSFIITNPTASSDLPLWRVPAGITIVAVHLLCKTQIIVGQLYQFDENGLNGATVDSADITGVVDTNIDDDGTLSAPTITAGHYIGWKTTSATAGATYAIITFDYIIT